MSSPGVRAAGTDGSDFRHRQRVAAHYTESIRNKFRLKCLLFLHVMLYALIFVKLFEEFLDWFEIDWSILERMELTSPHRWEWWWSASIFSVGLGMVASPRNNIKLMRWCYNSLFFLGLLPVAIGAGSLLPHLMRFISAGGDSSATFMGFPWVVLWYIFFTLAFQIHLFSMYFANKLIKSWEPVVRAPAGTAAAAAAAAAANGPVEDKKSE